VSVVYSLPDFVLQISTSILTLIRRSVLYYPFTPFFVLFCNVISTSDQGDHTLMEQFVDYLSEVKDLSPPIAKLHKLCVPFLNLASNMLESAESTISADAAARATIEYSPSPIPGTDAFQAFPTPLPRLSIPNEMPVIPDSVMQDSSMPPEFPTFTSNPPAPAGDVFWQLMDAQPRLQWLDSDFSGFEQAWGDGGFGDQEFLG
jgi:hypothetical protein